MPKLLSHAEAAEHNFQYVRSGNGGDFCFRYPLVGEAVNGVGLFKVMSIPGKGGSVVVTWNISAAYISKAADFAGAANSGLNMLEE